MYTGPEFEQIVVVTRPDGTAIRLGEIATVIDGFDDSDIATRFDGQRAAQVKVFRVGEQDALDVADTVKRYLQEKERHLPEGVKMAVWQDQTKLLRGRMNLLKRNGYMGLILVFLCLTLFLDVRLAFWTTLGIPISFLGAFWLMPMFGVSLNMISLFAFIMVLGIVVDDAIVVGENIFEYRQQGLGRVAAAIRGVQEMAAPVTMAVLTTIFTFVPLMYVTGIMGKIMRVIPTIVILVLAVSLTEALLILPAHLAGTKVRDKNRPGHHPIEALHAWIGRRFEAFVNGPFARFAMVAVRFRYATLAAGIVVLLATVGLVAGGIIKQVFFDPVEGDFMIATLTMPQGTPVEQTSAVLKRLEDAAFQVRDEYDREYRREGAPSIFRHMATSIGTQPVSNQQGPAGGGGSGISQGHLGEIAIELLGMEDGRKVSSMALKNRWEELVGEVPGVSSLTFEARIFRPGEAINIELTHEDFDQLVTAADELKAILRDYQGTLSIADSFEPGKAEIKLSLTDTGRTLGLTLGDLARQVRQGFYGEEVQRIQRGKHDIRVMLRYPLAKRRSLGDIENVRIRMPDGREIPFLTLAHVEYGRGYATIRRADRRRVVNVTANVDTHQANADEINQDLAQRVLPELMARYPGLHWRFAGEQRERAESFGALFRAFPIALLAIFGLLAVQFRSYVQPVIVMSAIPFGIVGAILGHIIMSHVMHFQFNLGLLSFFGIVALSGVVVNDSLIMIDLINRERRSGLDLHTVVRDSVTRRFRPIMLTTLTTFFGLTPMMFERSLQARFLIPMAISLAFGVAFATAITLILVPSLYMIVEDVKSIPRRLLGETEIVSVTAVEEEAAT